MHKHKSKGKDISEIHASIAAIELYLFETQVGMLVLELGYPKGSLIDDLIDANYLLKKLNLDNALQFQKGEDNPVELKLSDLCIALLEELGEVDLFEKVKISKHNQSNGGKQSKPVAKPANALVYSIVLLHDEFTRRQAWPELLKQYLFELRRSFKESYKPAQHEFDLENNPEIIQMFENSFWGVSLEGTANIIHKVEDGKTNEFFRGNYFENAGTTYFYLYIMALHQRYALLRLTIEASRLSKNPTSEEIAQMRQKISRFISRCFFRQVSNITHQAKLYNMLRKVFCIEELLQELHFELEVLSSLDESEKARKKAVQDKNENYIKSLLTVVSAIFVGINTSMTLINMFNSMVRPLIPGYYLQLLVFTLIILWTILLLFATKFISILRSPSKERETRVPKVSQHALDERTKNFETPSY